MDEKFRSRKWLLTCAVSLQTSVGFALGWLSAEDFVTLQTLCVGAYSFANAATAFSRR